MQGVSIKYTAKTKSTLFTQSHQQMKEKRTLPWRDHAACSLPLQHILLIPPFISLYLKGENVWVEVARPTHSSKPPEGSPVRDEQAFTTSSFPFSLCWHKCKSGWSSYSKSEMHSSKTFVYTVFYSTSILSISSKPIKEKIHYFNGLILFSVN